VGARGGDSSGGYTRIDGEGRCKPELIAPKNLTSFSTPVVTACAARLLEQGDRLAAQHPDNPAAIHATRPETIKAALLSGATKLKGWQPEDGKPLDSHMGAGRVNFAHSYEILAGKPSTDSKLRRSAGWRYQELGPTRDRTYRFEISRRLGETTVTLTWHRKVSGLGGRFNFAGQSAGRWSPQAGLANFDLELTRLDRHGQPEVVGESASDIDNVEHLYLEQLKPGRYRLKVSRKADGYDGAWPYALAWRIAPPSRTAASAEP
jgi:hypothetical protein